jgi:hypothetical protein
MYEHSYLIINGLEDNGQRLLSRINKHFSK